MSIRTRSTRSATITMRDVARIANVSQSTVSRVLSESSFPIPIGEETKQRVLEAVRELGYHPNLYAGSLRGQKTRLLAIMIADIANSFYHPIVRAVQDIAHQHRYDVLVANSDHLRENEMLFCESIIRRPVDGIIIAPYHLTNVEIDQLIVRTGAAVGVLGRHIDHPTVDSIFMNDDQAVYDAICWLIGERGHRRIGYIGVTRAFAVGARREDALRRALQDANIPANPTYFTEGDWSVESGEHCMQQLLALNERPSVVFACNDLMAIGAITAAQALNLRVPEDVAVLGFDNIPAATWTRPRLTTIAQKPAELGTQLANAVFDRIEGRTNGEHRRRELDCELIVRESA